MKIGNTVDLAVLRRAATAAMEKFKLSPGQRGIEIDDLINEGYIACASAQSKGKAGEGYAYTTAMWAAVRYIERELGIRWKMRDSVVRPENERFSFTDLGMAA